VVFYIATTRNDEIMTIKLNFKKKKSVPFFRVQARLLELKRNYSAEKRRQLKARRCRQVTMKQCMKLGLYRQISSFNLSLSPVFSSVLVPHSGIKLRSMNVIISVESLLESRMVKNV
jgi:hypothetical protein